MKHLKDLFNQAKKVSQNCSNCKETFKAFDLITNVMVWPLAYCTACYKHVEKPAQPIVIPWSRVLGKDE